MLFWIFLIALLASIIAAVLIDGYEHECAKGFTILVSLFLSLLVVILGTWIIVNNVTAESKVAEYKTRYEALTYQLENDFYENDNDIGKQELMEQVTEYNTEIATGRVDQDNFWYGIFFPDIYDDMEMIELEDALK